VNRRDINRAVAQELRSRDLYSDEVWRLARAYVLDGIPLPMAATKAFEAVVRLHAMRNMCTCTPCVTFRKQDQ